MIIKVKRYDNEREIMFSANLVRFVERHPPDDLENALTKIHFIDKLSILVYGNYKKIAEEIEKQQIALRAESRS